MRGQWKTGISKLFGVCKRGRGGICLQNPFLSFLCSSLCCIAAAAFLLSSVINKTEAKLFFQPQRIERTVVIYFFNCYDETYGVTFFFFVSPIV